MKNAALCYYNEISSVLKGRVPLKFGSTGQTRVTAVLLSNVVNEIATVAMMPGMDTFRYWKH